MKYLIYGTLLTGFFPYITIVSFGTDLQPWNVLFLITIGSVLMFYDYKFNKSIGYLFVVLVLSVFLVALSLSDLFSYVRSLFGYFVIALSPLVYHYIIKTKYNEFICFIKYSTLIWLIVALIQYFIDGSFGDIVLNMIRTGLHRGVTSLSPEPTFYGLIGIFYILIFLEIDYSKFKVFIYLWVFQIIFLSQSSMAILFLLMMFVFRTIFHNKFNKIVLVSLSIILLMFFAYYVLEGFRNVRAVNFFYVLLDSGYDVIYTDASINDRASSIYFSLKGFIDNFFLPHGMSSYNEYLSKELLQQEYFYYVTRGNGIMSYYGSMIFQLGIFWLVVPLSYSYIIYTRYRFSKKLIIEKNLFLHLILFSAIQMTTPLVGMYLGLLLFNAKYNSNYTACRGNQSPSPLFFVNNKSLNNSHSIAKL